MLYDQRVRLNTELVSWLKSFLKEENLADWTESGYGGSRFWFKLPADIPMPNTFMKGEIFDNEIAFLLRFITGCNPITTEIKHKLKLRKGHIELIRSCFFEYDREENTIGLGYKRPFGNSDVMGDVFDAFKKPKYDREGNRKYDEKLITECIMKVKDYLIHADFDEDLEANYSLYGFKLTESYLRKIKIKGIIDAV
jgi:hypothetical protein